MQMLKDLMGTKYICDWHCSEFREVCEQHAGEEIDLADCFFTQKAAVTLGQCEDKCKFVHTKDVNLNTLLQSNREATRAREAIKNQRIIPYQYQSLDEVLEFIHSVEEGEIVSAEQATMNKAVVFAVIHLLQGYRPDVKVHLAYYNRSYFEEVRQYWLPRATECSCFVEFSRNRVREVAVNEGMVLLEDGTLCDEKKYRETHLVLPKEFGTIRVEKDSVFYGLLERAYKTLVHATLPSVKMKDFLISGEVS